MTTPAVPEPDAKDWTWTLRDRCPDCGFDTRAVEPADVPARAREYAAAIRAAATAPGGAERPAPATWSATEYACHVRDVCALFDERLRLMLTEDDPLFANWDQDETALQERYWEQEPAAVAEQLRVNADRIAEHFATVAGDQWQRPGRRSNGSEFTVDSFARYFLHDLAHHAWDVGPGRQPAR